MEEHHGLQLHRSFLQGLTGDHPEGTVSSAVTVQKSDSHIVSTTAELEGKNISRQLET